MPAFQPYRGKPVVRNDREGRGNVGIIRSPVRASTLPDCGGRSEMSVPTASEKVRPRSPIFGRVGREAGEPLRSMRPLRAMDRDEAAGIGAASRRGARRVAQSPLPGSFFPGRFYAVRCVYRRYWPKRERRVERRARAPSHNYNSREPIRLPKPSMRRAKDADLFHH
jgi:hypothetical protein